MATVEKKRIINLAEKSAPENGDFFAVDSQAGGTKKIPTTAIAKAADLTAEAAARTQADNALTSAINSASALIQNPTKTLSGALVSFTDGADMPMVACTAEIVPKQSGTGTPSPDNVRQISGWESVVLTDVGKNIYNGEGVTIIGRPVERGTTLYTQVFDGTFTNATLYAKTLTADWVAIDSFSQFKHTLTINRDDILEIKISNSAYRDLNNAGSHLMASFTDFDTYAPYNGHTTTTPLGRTVYGGTADVVTGVLTVDRAMVDLGTLNWSYVGAGTANSRFESNLPSQTIGSGQGATVPTNILCSNYEVASFSAIYNHSKDKVIGLWSASVGALTSSIIAYDSAYTNAADFKSAMSGAQLVYELATPQTYTLTGQEVNTLLGDNNVWADSGDVEITYRRDISIVLENLENALSGSNSLNTMMMSAPTENTAEEPTEDEAEDDMR